MTDWLVFIEVLLSKKAKTKKWEVRHKDTGILLGYIKWYYSFLKD